MKSENLFRYFDWKKVPMPRKERKRFRVLPLLFMLVISFVVQGSSIWARQGKVVYVSDQMGSMDIWIMNEDGSDKTRLTFDDSTSEMDPHFSPDGERLAYTRLVGKESRLMMMNRDGSDPTCVRTYPYGSTFYEWSSCDWLVIGANSRSTCFVDDLLILRPDGSDERIILKNVPTHGAAVSPDGQSVLYVKSVYCWTPYNQIRMIDIDGTNDSSILPNDRKAEFWPSYFNQDLRQFVFHQSDSGSGHGNPVNLYSMKDDGTGKTKITNLTGNRSFNCPIMSHDDSRILCHYYNGDNCDIAIIDKDGKNLVNLTNSPYKEILPDWYEPTCSFGPADQPLVFVRGKGKPVIENVNWESCGGNGKMKIAYHRSASAHIYLNGLEIVSPDMLNNNTKRLEIPIILEEGSNIIQVNVKGKPTGRLEIEFIEE